MIDWRLFEVKQHNYKLVLGWVSIWWVVLLIRCRKACYNHNIDQEPNAGGDSWLLCKQWFRRLTSGLNLVFLRLLLSTFVRTDQTYLASTDYLWPSQENFSKQKNHPDKYFYTSATKHLGIGLLVGLFDTNFKKVPKMIYAP